MSLTETMEQHFSLGEANVALEGLDPFQHPLYAKLKADVLAGRMTASEMGDALIEHSLTKRAHNPAA